MAWVLSTHLYGAFDCMFLSSHIGFSEWIHTQISLNVQEIPAESRRHIWSLSDCNWARTYNHLFRKRTLNHLAKLTNSLGCVLSTYMYGAFDCMFWSCPFQSESTLYSCLNVKELVARSRHETWSISLCICFLFI